MKFCWSTLHVRDMDESLKFYRDLIGLQLMRRFPAGPGMEIAFLGDGDTKIELIQQADIPKPAVGPDISWGFEVESLEEVLKMLAEHGIPIESGPFQPNPQTRFVFVLDPNGLKIQFVENQQGENRTRS